MKFLFHFIVSLSLFAVANGLVSIDLADQLDGSTLAYVVNRSDPRAAGQDTVTMTYSVPKQAWLAIGFSRDGRMIESEAVIGLPDSGQVLKYSLNSYLQSGVVPMAQQTLIDTSIEQTAGLTTMTFTKILQETGEITINIGANILLGAYGFDNNLSYHERRSAFGLELVATEVVVDSEPEEVTEDAETGQVVEDTETGEVVTDTTVGEAPAVFIIQTRKQGLWKAHGICAGLAWGLLSPLAIGVSVLRSWFPQDWWFTIHKGLNMAVIVLTVFAFAFAVAAIQAEGFSHFNGTPHRVVGLIVVILAVTQMFGGIFRPHTPKEGEKKTSSRKRWEIGHRVLGFVTLALAWFQIASGIKIYQTLFVNSASTNLTGIFGGVVGTIVVIVAVGRVATMLMEKKKAQGGIKVKIHA